MDLFLKGSCKIFSCYESFGQKILEVTLKLQLPYIRINCKTASFATPYYMNEGGNYTYQLYSSRLENRWLATAKK